MSDSQQPPPASPLEVVTPGQSWPAILFLIVVSAGFAAMSAIALAYQWGYELPDGTPFRETPGAWLHLSGHLIRAAGGAAVAWSLWRYARSARAGEVTAADRSRLFADLEVVWVCMGLAVGAHVAHAAASFGMILRAA